MKLGGSEAPGRIHPGKRCGVRRRYLMRLPGEQDFTPCAAPMWRRPSVWDAIVRTGGGGWGDPLERDPRAVQQDVAEEFISAQAALRDYGVVLTASREPDMDATQARRARMRMR